MASDYTLAFRRRLPCSTAAWGPYDGVTVGKWASGFGQTYDYVVNQLGKVSGALLIAEMKVV